MILRINYQDIRSMVQNDSFINNLMDLYDLS